MQQLFGAPMIKTSSIDMPEDVVGDWTEVWGARLGTAWAYQESGRTNLANTHGHTIGSVTGWLNGLHLESAGTNRPTVDMTAKLANHPSWAFDGSNDYLRSIVSATINSADSSGWFMYVVAATLTSAGRLFAAMDSDTVGNDYSADNGCSVASLGGGSLRLEHLVPEPSPIVGGHPDTNAYCAILIDDANGQQSIYGGNGGVATEAFASKGGFMPDRIFVNAGVSGGITFYGTSKIVEMGLLNRLPTAKEIVQVLHGIRSYYGSR